MLVAFFAHVLVPLIALVTVAVIQFDQRVALPLQVAEGGTDLCILAIGATGSLFISPTLHEKFGSEWGADQHHDCAGHGDACGCVDSCEPLGNGAGSAGEG